MKMTPHEISRAEAALMAQWREDPILFVRDNFGLLPADDYVDPVPGRPPEHEYLDYFQEEMLAALVKHDRIALLASKGPGKTAGEAIAIWWFMACNALCNGAAISYTADQLSANLWKELRKWQQRSPYLVDRFEWSAQKIAHKVHGSEWWFEARSWPKTASPDEQAESLAGLHADSIMVVMDESGAIPVGVLVTAEAILANKIHDYQVAKVIQAGNPTTRDGALFHATHKQREKWWVKEITGDPDDPKRARRVSKEWARDMIRQFGRDHPFVRVNVLGKFPLSQSNTLIGAEFVEAAIQRELTPPEYDFAPIVMGVDVARFGDDRTVICRRQGKLVYEDIRTLRSQDEFQVAGEVARLIAEWNVTRCYVDEIGPGGGVVSILQHNGFQGIVHGVNSAQRKTCRPRYFNMRAQMWDEMRQWVENGGKLPDNPVLAEELSTPTYEYRPDDGKLILEDKDEIKKRLGSSPDYADALSFTFAGPVPIDMGDVTRRKLRRAAQTTAGNVQAPTRANMRDWRKHG